MTVTWPSSVNEMEKMTIYSGLSIKVILLISSWVFAQVQPLAEMGINKSFDFGFSIGMMSLFIVYMIYENRKKDTKIIDHQEIYVNLLEKNMDAMTKFSEALVLMNKSLDSAATERKDLFKEISEHLRQLNNNLSNRS